MPKILPHFFFYFSYGCNIFTLRHWPRFARRMARLRADFAQIRMPRCHGQTIFCRRNVYPTPTGMIKPTRP
jgi:hypothetical protein